jgi:hypothetical protein
MSSGRATNERIQIAIAVRGDAPASSGGAMKTSGSTALATRMRLTACTCPKPWKRPSSYFCNSKKDVATAGIATTHQRSPSSGATASATAPVASPPTVAITSEPPKSSLSVVRRCVISTTLLTQTAPSGSTSSAVVSEASA